LIGDFIKFILKNAKAKPLSDYWKCISIK